VTAPHFLKNAAFYGNPVYPFAQGTFASHPTVPNAPYLVEWILKDYKFRPHHGLVQTVGEALGLALAWPVSAHYSFSQDVPDGGALFTLCLPIAFFVRGRRRLWLGMATGLGALFAWAMVFRVDRHIQGFMPILAASTAAVLTRAWELGGVARAGIAALVGLQVVWGGDAPFYGARERFVAAFDILRASHDGKPGARFAKARPSYRKIADALPADARVLLHEVKPSLGIDRDVILDTPGRQGLVSYAGVRGLRGLHELYRSLGVTHLLWRPGARAASTRQEDVLFSDYVLRYGAHPKRFADKRLVEIPSEPPPEDHSYKVLALGLKGYKDGLYPVEAMTTYEAIPPPPADTHEVYAKPERRFPKDLAAQIELANAADAVCVAESFDGGSRALEAALDARFELAAQHGTFAIYVVRRRDAPEEPGDKPSDKPGEPSGPADVEDDR
jgi:hypothetical protein